MRPVVKGLWVGTFTHWREARDPLMERIGNYCSYCECPPFQSDVEHKEPKADPKYANRALDWDNFLLACGYCNSIKQDQDTRAKPFLFSDEHNTAYAFIYHPSGRLEINPLLQPHEQVAATNTRDELVQLNRIQDTNRNRDLRWQRRLDVWREAREALSNLQQADSVPLRRQIERTAVGWGCFSVWMTVFATDSDMCRRFIAAFTGTNPSCFDADGQCHPHLIV